MGKERKSREICVCVCDEEKSRSWDKTWKEIVSVVPNLEFKNGIGANFKNWISPEGRAPTKTPVMKEWTTETVLEVAIDKLSSESFELTKLRILLLLSSSSLRERPKETTARLSAKAWRRNS
ncbi:hypothetical protein TNCV_2018451 [Trichonephila clavipes]|nr:hypothetical protein TNCV_2018451 [Trichonephila clavipes]